VSERGTGTGKGKGKETGNGNGNKIEIENGREKGKENENEKFTRLWPFRWSVLAPRPFLRTNVNEIVWKASCITVTATAIVTVIVEGRVRIRIRLHLHFLARHHLFLRCANPVCVLQQRLYLHHRVGGHQWIWIMNVSATPTTRGCVNAKGNAREIEIGRGRGRKSHNCEKRNPVNVKGWVTSK
jgi:hypothetical protein